MSDNIPFDIQIEIIKRVPDVNSLVHFRSVSKPWKSFIDSSEFITGYGARDIQPHSLLLRYIDDNVSPYEVKYVSFLDDVTFPQQQLDFAPNVPNFIKQLIYSEVIGSSCGLWGLYGYNSSEKAEMVVIWNPSIRKSVGIIVPSLLNHFAFGVPPSTYDPTIVLMSCSYGYLDTKDTDKWQVEIFTLSSKTWKMIPSSNLPRESIGIRWYTHVSIDRFIFWVAFCTNAANDGVSELKDLILSFDLITHDFKEVHLPVSIPNRVSRYISISKLNESLVVSAYTVEVNDELVYNIWMMGEEGGVMTSFTNLFTINTPVSPISALLEFRKSGEPIMETLKEEEEFVQFAALEVYEPCSKHINDLGIYGKPGSFFIAPTQKHFFLLITRMVVLSPTIVEEQNDCYHVRCGAIGSFQRSCGVRIYEILRSQCKFYRSMGLIWCL